MANATQTAGLGPIRARLSGIDREKLLRPAFPPRPPILSSPTLVPISL